jgi:hypothetical protein
VAGNTRTPEFGPLSTFDGDPRSAHSGFLEHLRRHDGFKEVVWKHATGTLRARVATVSALMGWVDVVPRIRTMIEDPDLDVREAAAVALLALTGEKPEITRPATVFPAVDRRDGLLAAPRTLPRLGAHDANFITVLPWFDGGNSLICGFTNGYIQRRGLGEVRILTDALESAGAWPMPYELRDLVRLPIAAGGFQVVGLVNLEGKGAETWQGVVAWTNDGHERWRRKTGARFLKDIAPIFGEQGCVGVAIAAGGKTGIVAVDLEGEPLWDVARKHVLYHLSTHERLPGYVLSTGGDVRIFGHRGKEVHELHASSRHSGYARHGVLFPDAGGSPSAVIAGEDLYSSVPRLRRIDAKGQVVWEAALSAEIEGLALLEPRGGPRLLAVTTERGELLLVDDVGTLLWRGDMPEVDPEHRVATYQLVAGEIGPDRYGVVVRLLHDSYLYGLNLDALKAEKPR